jgi:hypothetical protein
VQGIQGDPGPAGPQGVQGNPGPSGPQGVQGNPGASGPQGPQGVQGIDGADGTGVNILGSYDSLAALTAAHPTGNAGEAYLVSGSLYVWNTGSGKWENVGNIQGPQGVQGVQGVKGDPGPAGPQGIQGNPGPAGPQGIQGNSGAAGPQGIQGNPGPAGPQSQTVIPFASATTAYVGTTTTGAPRNAGLITFGGDPLVVTLGPNETVSLGRNNQSAFSLPFNAILENVYINVGPLTNFTFPTGLTVYPFVELFAAAPASNVFTALPQTKTVPASGFSGAVTANTMLVASVNQIGVQLTAGTRIIISGQMQITGSGVLFQNYYFHYTGGIALRPT